MNIFASFEPIFMWFWDEIPHSWGFTQLWVFTQWWEANENWLFQFWPITGVLTQWWGTNRIVFLPGGKWSDWLRVICFVFKIVVPKHRFCKLQNVWNVCEFGSDYKISPNPNWPHPKLDQPQIGPIPNWFELQIGPRPKLVPSSNWPQS